MDIDKKIFEGEAVEQMTKLEGWRILDKWLNDRRNEAISKLIQAKTMEEVIRLQENICFVDNLNGRIRHLVRAKNEALETLQEEAE